MRINTPRTVSGAIAHCHEIEMCMIEDTRPIKPTITLKDCLIRLLHIHNDQFDSMRFWQRVGLWLITKG